MPEELSPQRQAVAEAFARLGGNVSATARELGLSRATVRYHVKKLGHVKPLVGGQVEPKVAKAKLPPPGQIKRYIITSAQNNTKLYERVWDNLLSLAKHYDAELLVGTFSYNQNAYGKLSVKRGKVGEQQKDLWYDERLEPYICDETRELGHGLVWCGEMNIMPTTPDPLSGLETYSGRKSGVFPHAKHAMRSIATMMHEGTKFNYTTGTVTLQNYIQKKAGIVAEHHHSYGALIVEVDSDGHWWVRQLQADDRGRIYDLDVLVEVNGSIHANTHVEAITWGDLHATILDPDVAALSLGDKGMLATLKPNYQFIHDLLEGVSVNHHAARNPHEQFKKFLRGFDSVEAELVSTVKVLQAYERPGTKTVVVDSNHDNWFMKWLREHDYRTDPRNALLFLESQVLVFQALRRGDALNLTEYLMRRFGCPDDVRFLKADESLTICNKRIECGMHGHLGPNGAHGSASNLSKVGRRANIGHTHSAGIWNGLFVAGTSTNLDMGYNKGPSSWSHSHIVTYRNGRRTIVTMFAGKWRA